MAGTTITAVFGDNGIVTKAQQASKATQKANVIEGIQMDILTASFDGDITESKLNTILNQYGTVSTDADDNVILTVEDIGDIDITDIYISALGSETGAATLASQVTAANYGDYVEYSVDLNDDGDCTNDWKVFYNDGEHVFIIASDYLDVSIWTQPCANAEITTDTVFSKYCVWWDDPTSKGYDNFGDDEGLLALFGFNYINNYSFEISNNAHHAVAGLLDINNWEEFVDYDVASCAIGSPTIEMWKASWDEVYAGDTFTLSENEYGYLGNDYDCLAYLDVSKGYDDALYFPYKKEVEYCSNYWLASPAGEYAGGVLLICRSGEVADDDYYDPQCSGLRPLVCLNSDILGTSTTENGVTTWSLISGS